MIDRKVMGRNKSYEVGHVVRESMLLFKQKGFNATSVAELVSVTGLNKKSLYHEFSSKEGLFTEALKSYEAEFNQRMLPLLLENPPGLHNIIAFFREYIEFMDTDGCLFTLSLNENRSVSEAHNNFVINFFFQVEEHMHTNLKAEYDDERYPEVDARILAKNLIASLQGLSSYIKSNPDPEDFKKMVDNVLRSLPKKVSS